VVALIELLVHKHFGNCGNVVAILLFACLSEVVLQPRTDTNHTLNCYVEVKKTQTLFGFNTVKLQNIGAVLQTNASGDKRI